MTEREKMLSGELYDPTDKELEQLRLNARKLARKYNLTDEDQPEEQAQILQELLPTTEELPYLQAPVYFGFRFFCFLLCCFILLHRLWQSFIIIFFSSPAMY